jgi:octaprenyl-diphosphate synthase
MHTLSKSLVILHNHMTTLETIRTAIATDIERLYARIKGRLSTDNPMLQDIINANLKNGGKMIRPIIVILSAQMLGDVNDHVIDAAASVELLHNASLVHDDVVDGSKTRRGTPTINAVWQNHIAVLVGDFYVSTAMQLAIATENVNIVNQLCNLGRQLSLGELNQIYNARYHTLTEEAYYKVIDFKTASLFKACAAMGCYAQEVDDERAQALRRYAQLLGLCFQVRDDIFDYYSDEKVGKPTGNDLREGKITLPLLHVLLDENAPKHEEMLALSRKDQLSDAEIDTLMAYARDNGGIDYAYQSMKRMRDEAVESLAIFADSQTKTWLLELLDYIIARDY